VSSIILFIKVLAGGEAFRASGSVTSEHACGLLMSCLECRLVPAGEANDHTSESQQGIHTYGLPAVQPLSDANDRSSSQLKQPFTANARQAAPDPSMHAASARMPPQAAASQHSPPSRPAQQTHQPAWPPSALPTAVQALLSTSAQPPSQASPQKVPTAATLSFFLSCMQHAAQHCPRKPHTSSCFVAASGLLSHFGLSSVRRRRPQCQSAQHEHHPSGLSRSLSKRGILPHVYYVAQAPWLPSGLLCMSRLGRGCRRRPLCQNAQHKCHLLRQSTFCSSSGTLPQCLHKRPLLLR